MDSAELLLIEHQPMGHPCRLCISIGMSPVLKDKHKANATWNQWVRWCTKRKVILKFGCYNNYL